LSCIGSRARQGIIVTRLRLLRRRSQFDHKLLARLGVWMERRLHTRHRARTTVYILLPDGQRRLCRAVNLSATGVFIRTAGLGLRKGQQVSLAFAIDLGAVTKLHRRTAVVAHISGGGTGLMMDAFAATR
jgi:uncharacterized membrane-anchored protein